MNLKLSGSGNILTFQMADKVLQRTAQSILIICQTHYAILKLDQSDEFL
jgi:hypothetical protein